MPGECEECGEEIWGPKCPTKPAHDGDGNYYVIQYCPYCEATLMRMIPNYELGFELEDDAKEMAELDPNPPNDLEESMS